MGSTPQRRIAPLSLAARAENPCQRHLDRRHRRNEPDSSVGDGAGGSTRIDSSVNDVASGEDRQGAPDANGGGAGGAFDSGGADGRDQTGDAAGGSVGLDGSADVVKSDGSPDGFDADYARETTPPTYTPPPGGRSDIRSTTAGTFCAAMPPGRTAAFNDSSWGTVNLPHTWNNMDGQDGGSALLPQYGLVSPALHARPRNGVQERLSAIRRRQHHTDVWVNGTSLGQHRGGCAASA